MKKETEVQATEKPNEKRLFDLSNISFKDLKGNVVKINFDNQDFGNTLFTRAVSVQMSRFGEAIHDGKEAEIYEGIAEILPKVYEAYGYRAGEAVKEYLSTHFKN